MQVPPEPHSIMFQWATLPATCMSMVPPYLPSAIAIAWFAVTASAATSGTGVAVGSGAAVDIAMAVDAGCGTGVGVFAALLVCWSGASVAAAPEVAAGAGAEVAAGAVASGPAGSSAEPQAITSSSPTTSRLSSNSPGFQIRFDIIRRPPEFGRQSQRRRFSPVETLQFRPNSCLQKPAVKSLQL